MKKFFSSSAMMHLILVLVITIYICFRLIPLLVPFFTAELSYFFVSIENSFLQLFTLNHWDKVHPPLMYVLTKLAFISLPISPYSLLITIRVISIICSTIAVILIYQFVKKEKIYSKKIAPLSLILVFTVFPELIKQSYLARPYGVMLLLLSLSLFSLKNKVWLSAKNVLLFNSLFIFMFFWDYSSVWFFLTFYIYFLSKKDFLFILKRTLPFIIACLMWLPTFITNLNNSLELEKYISNSFIVLYARLVHLIGLNINNSLVEKSINFPSLILLSVPIFIIFNVLKKEKKLPRIYTFFILGGTIPIILSGIFTLYVSPIFVPQNLLFAIFCLPFLINKVIDIKQGEVFIFFILTLFISNMIHNNFIYIQTPDPVIFPQNNNFFYESENMLVIYASDKDDIDFSIRYNLLQDDYQNNKKIDSKSFHKIRFIYFKDYLINQKNLNKYKIFVVTQEKNSEEDLQELYKICNVNSVEKKLIEKNPISKLIKC